MPYDFIYCYSEVNFNNTRNIRTGMQDKVVFIFIEKFQESEDARLRL